ncbi:radical SAM protein [Clostridia bacterium]|nr:radical SAM protein [Clostridia bacterium]
MKIGLWADTVNFPSLPLMKLSAYHKAQGDTVKLVTNGIERFDIAYCSKTFHLPEVRKIPTLDFFPNADAVYYGGTGGAITVIDGKEVYDRSKDPPLPKEVEHIYPDYGLYPAYTENMAYGFLTRGCPNGCGFCLVSGKEGCRSIQTADLSEFWRGQKEIKLMDANLLACKNREKLIETLIASKARIDYTQGLDARFITEDTAKLVCRTNIKIVHFAFDLVKNEGAILRGLEIFRRHFEKSDRACCVYVLTNYDTTPAQDWYRVKKVMELGYTPDVRIYRKGTHSKFLTDLSRWANHRRIYRSCSFVDYVPRVDGRRCGELYADILSE